MADDGTRSFFFAGKKLFCSRNATVVGGQIVSRQRQQQSNVEIVTFFWCVPTVFVSAALITTPEGTRNSSRWFPEALSSRLSRRTAGRLGQTLATSDGDHFQRILQSVWPPKKHSIKANVQDGHWDTGKHTLTGSAIGLRSKRPMHAITFTNKTSNQWSSATSCTAYIFNGRWYAS